MLDYFQSIPFRDQLDKVIQECKFLQAVSATRGMILVSQSVGGCSGSSKSWGGSRKTALCTGKQP